MKVSASIFSAFIAGSMSASAFVAPSHAPVAFTRSSDVAAKAAATSALKSMSDELDIPCDDDCALDNYPSLPESVHPGVLSGQAMVDLLDHAKANGACACLRQLPLLVCIANGEEICITIFHW